MTAAPHTVLLFVDGLGLADPDPERNPVHSGVAPTLSHLIREHAKPVDAGLGVPGLPQSATGQTALLTGINAPAAMGRHIEGFPGPGLCRIIKEHNIFARFQGAGRRSTFANGYSLMTADEARRLRLRSVTTVSTLSAFGEVRNLERIERNEAVCQDLTRESMRLRGYEGPLRTPTEAAEDLRGIIGRHDFTLFEFFQTDRAGHSCDIETASGVLRKYDTFLTPLAAAAESGEILLLLCSDHGNIEDLSTHTHTRNPVPLVALGPRADEVLATSEDIADVTPAVLRLHGIG
jgi:hypothetical protein